MPKRRPGQTGHAGRGEPPAALRRRRRGPPRLASAAVALAVGSLILQHGLLLAQRIGEGSLLEPAVLWRWLVGLALATAMLNLRRAGLPLLRGRRAAVLWLAVLVFHVALAAAPAAPHPARLPGAALPALALLTALGLGSRPGPAVAVASRVPQPRPAPVGSRAFLAVLAARPPPAALA